ncbi:hypothetical protein CVM52_06780 [Pseudooceanicola lipolyticus]|uniref:Lipoprotein n=1 Tax=Pseudooceanicola lipolyticus TaxID=2029104 RepID=A0A2M8J3W5_9RHOB|nr:hypothetical protein [Pseudooceanicola lipolyticus]PJE37465.1 hypothetical protein CVM52_06780 [Pseudooceanicola lipolyticus]
MRKSISLILIASLITASCGWRDSRVNPRNWFGNSRDVPVEVVDAEANPLIPRQRRGALAREERPDASVPIASVIELNVEPTTSGAIVHATGIAERQGAFQARLVPDNPELEPTDGVLSFSFRVLYPNQATPVGSEFSRTIHEAYSLTLDELARIRVIRVVAAGNARETRRR